MSFVINQERCAICGSCLGNCPNRAIIKKGENIYVTEMCCDCGVCIQYCSMGAIGMGKTKAELDHKKLDRALKDKLALQRDIVAVQYADESPEGVTVEEGPTFWCSICGDIFEGAGNPLFFSAKASTCGGSNNVGIGAKKTTKEEFEEVINAQVIGEGHLYATKDLLAKGRNLFPRFPRIYKGVVLGSLECISVPDMILFPLNGKQMCMVSTAYGFDTGEVITGYAGKSTCLMSTTYPFVENKPVFTSGDHGGRTFMRLKDEEFLLCFPYRLVPGLVRNLERTVYAHEGT